MHLVGFCDLSLFVEIGNMLNDNFGRDPWMFPYGAYFVSLPNMSFQFPAVGSFVWVDEV